MPTKSKTSLDSVVENTEKLNESNAQTGEEVQAENVVIDEIAKEDTTETQ